MCMIIYKPKGKVLPDKEELIDIERENPHGLGMMFVENGRVMGYKGLNVHDVLHYTKKDRREMVHFRLGTSGKMNVGANHPFLFPADKVEMLMWDTWKADMGIMHNGMIRGYGNDNLSDTQDYILQFSKYPDLAAGIYRFDKFAIKLFEAGQKWGIMRKDGAVKLLGSWKEKDELWYSSDPFGYGWEWSEQEDSFNSLSFKNWKKDKRDIFPRRGFAEWSKFNGMEGI